MMMCITYTLSLSTQSADSFLLFWYLHVLVLKLSLLKQFLLENHIPHLVFFEIKTLYVVYKIVIFLYQKPIIISGPGILLFWIFESAMFNVSKSIS